jgi:hypothetical protein
MKKQIKNILVITGIVLLILLIWGLIGSSQVAPIGVTCDLGLGEDGSALCWKWHQNTIGEFGEKLSEFFGK